MDPLISVIIPVYKVEPYLHQCVNSVINQTYKNLEIILVDDGSPDRCPQICDDFAKSDSRIKVIHKENGGLSDARNAGLDIANGDYIGFIDSDDFIAENYFETLYNAIVKDNTLLSMTAYLKVDFQGEKCSDQLIYSPGCYSGLELINIPSNVINSGIVIVAHSKLYKKELWNDIRFPKGKIYEDNFVFYKIMVQCAKISIIPNRLYFYRILSSGLNKSNHNTINRLDITEARLRRITDLNIKNTPLDNLRTLFDVIAIFDMYYKETNFYLDESHKKRNQELQDLYKQAYPYAAPGANFKQKIHLILRKMSLFYTAKILHLFHRI